MCAYSNALVLSHTSKLIRPRRCLVVVFYYKQTTSELCGLSPKYRSRIRYGFVHIYHVYIYVGSLLYMYEFAGRWYLLRNVRFSIKFFGVLFSRLFFVYKVEPVIEPLSVFY